MLNILQQDISISFSLLIFLILNFNFLATFGKVAQNHPGIFQCGFLSFLQGFFSRVFYKDFSLIFL